VRDEQTKGSLVKVALQTETYVPQMQEGQGIMRRVEGWPWRAWATIRRAEKRVSACRCIP
jgi:hypothetical protein